MKIIFTKLETNKSQIEVSINKKTSVYYEVKKVKEEGIDLSDPIYDEADSHFAIVGAAIKVVPTGMDTAVSKPYTYLYLSRHFTYEQAAELTYGELSANATI